MPISPVHGGKGSSTANGGSSEVVLVESASGYTIVTRPTPLTRLHYFDGKFLRAEDLDLEQRYLRHLSALGNRAGGWGVVHGLTAHRTADGSDALVIDGGLAIAPDGSVILLPGETHTVPIAELLTRSSVGGRTVTS